MLVPWLPGIAANRVSGSNASESGSLSKSFYPSLFIVNCTAAMQVFGAPQAVQ
jgi:hypothetical protein